MVSYALKVVLSCNLIIRTVILILLGEEFPLGILSQHIMCPASRKFGQRQLVVVNAGYW